MSTFDQGKRDSIDLADRLQKAVELVNCIIMAASSLADRDKMNAIASVGYSAVEVIEGVQIDLAPEDLDRSSEQKREVRGA